MSQKASVVAIVGRTNVGKSSLFNAILGRRETIVAKEPGTTRDSISAKTTYSGRDFWLVDTAGLKSAEDEFELTIQDQIKESAATADVILLVVEANVPIVNEDRRLAKLTLKAKKPVILVVNKIDKARLADLVSWKGLGIKDILATSTTQKTGIEELLDKLIGKLKQAIIHTPKDLIGLTILGRPNVGKSSLFNTLAAKQQAPWNAGVPAGVTKTSSIPLGQALVSPQAGTTRDVNRINLNYHGRQLELSDTAGIRRSGKIGRGVEHFSLLRTLAAIEQADVCIVVMDAHEPNVALDQKIAGLVKTAGKGLILAINKWDQAADKSSKAKVAAEVAAHFEFVPWAPLVFTSATAGVNVTKLFELALEIATNRDLRIKTSDLNTWLGKTTSQFPPVGHGGSLPKLKYIVQENDVDMPSFKIFGSHLKSLHWSYRRYLERQFREAWPFEGTPIKFWFIQKQLDKEKTIT